MSDEKRFVCVAKCPELDLDNERHCCGTQKEIDWQYERYEDSGCPVGNIPEWVEEDKLNCFHLRRKITFK